MAINRYKSGMGGGVRMLALVVALSACGDSIPAVNNLDIGSIDVYVVDQNGAGVPNAEIAVSIPSPGGGGVDTQLTSQGGGVIGAALFEQMTVGSHTVTVSPPTGYTGGGAANAVTVNVAFDSTSTTTLHLVKSNPSG